MKISIMRRGFHYPYLVSLTSPQKAGPLKKLKFVVKKCRSVVLAMEAFGTRTRTTQVTRIFLTRKSTWEMETSRQRWEESGRCFNSICCNSSHFFRGGTSFFSNISRHFQHILEVGASKLWGTCRKNTPLKKENHHLNQTIIFKFNMLDLPG